MSSRWRRTMPTKAGDRGDDLTREIEAKARCADPEALRRRLVELGARRRASGLEHNVVFDTPRGDMGSADRLLRLRRYGKNFLTYKGPRGEPAGIVKSRAEVEVEVSDFAATARLLEGLGYVRAWVYEKKRETWDLDGVQVLLDTLPGIGHYVEVEAASEALVVETFSRLGLSAGQATSLTYLELFQEYLDEKGLDLKEMVFEEKERG